ncbi:MAG TPA: DHA2 family efflux MFS transporter permease subunit [Roseomonas sp.]
MRAGDPRLTAAVVASALFMQNLDGSAVATALPAMARDFGMEAPHLGAAVTAYLVSLTVFIPASGWIADRFGAKRIFLLAIAIFTIASVLCGAAQSFGQLVGARVLQGIGGAMMVPVGRLLLLRGVRKDELIQATTWLTMPALIGPVIGPPLGGFVTDALSWRWVFWINIPVGILGILAAWRFVPKPVQAAPPPLDAMGLVLAGVALAMLMFGLENAGRGLVPPAVWIGAILLGFAIGVQAVRHARRVPQPAIDLTLLRIPTFHAAVIAGTVFRIAAGCSPFLLALTLQTGFGWSASESGSVAFASAVGAFAMKPMTRPLLRAFGFRNVLIGNGALAAAGIASAALFTPHWPAYAIFIVLMAGGLARSLQFTSYNTLAFADLASDKLSAGTSLYGIAQQLPQALGVVLASAVITICMAAGGRTTTGLVDFEIAFVVAGLLALVSVPMSLRLSPDAGEEVTGHHQRAKDVG